MENRAIKYRQACDGDVESMAAIDGATHGHWGMDQFKHELSLSFSRTIVALEGEKAVGFIVTWFIAPELQIQNIAVHPEYRRRSVGMNLIRHTLAELPGREPLSIILEVREGNTAARRFYSSLGFREISVRKAYYGDEDAVVLQVNHP